MLTALLHWTELQPRFIHAEWHCIALPSYSLAMALSYRVRAIIANAAIVLSLCMSFVSNAHTAASHASLQVGLLHHKLRGMADRAGKLELCLGWL